MSNQEDSAEDSLWGVNNVKLNVSHLRVFGSMCFRHVPRQLRKKLDDRSQTMVLIGYYSTGAYKLYSPNNDKIMINRDVLVDERKGWEWIHD